MGIPADLKYTQEHEWIRLGEDNTAFIGITDFAQSELGDIVYVEVETVGESLGKGDVFGAVEAVKTTSDLYMPVSGNVLEFNAKLDGAQGDNPALVNDDPYGDGWIIKVALSNPAELDELLDAAAYEKLIS